MGSVKTTIILYDIPSNLPQNAWTPNTWKTRYTLNFKGIPYTTEWVEYPDIEKLSKKLGMKPTSKRALDGKDLYTLPAIHDPSTGVYLSESALIAEYLDKQYPDTPALFPHNTVALQHAFAYAFMDVLNPILRFALTPSVAILHQPSAEYFRYTREAFFGTTMEDLVPKGEDATQQWEKLEANFGKVDGWYAKTDELGQFMLGTELSWADVNIAALLTWARTVWGRNDQKWKDIMGWHGGRWERLMKEFEEKYGAVH